MPWGRYTFFALPWEAPSTSWPTGVEVPLCISNNLCVPYWSPRFYSAYACLQTDCGGYDIPVEVDNACGTVAVQPTTWTAAKLPYR
jgi:hypothetical protein